MLHIVQDLQPSVSPTAYIAPTADLIGAVTLHDRSSVWFQAVLRADDAPITIDSDSNIQDGVVIHVETNIPVNIGRGVTVGHRAIIHASDIGDGSLIGMGAIILSRCKIGENCLIAAGTLLPEGTVIPPGSVVMGSTGKVVKTLSDKLIQRLKNGSQHYIDAGALYQQHCKALSKQTR